MSMLTFSVEEEKKEREEIAEYTYSINTKFHIEILHPTHNNILRKITFQGNPKQAYDKFLNFSLSQEERDRYSLKKKEIKCIYAECIPFFYRRKE